MLINNSLVTNAGSGFPGNPEAVEVYWPDLGGSSYTFFAFPPASYNNLDLSSGSVTFLESAGNSTWSSIRTLSPSPGTFHNTSSVSAPVWRSSK